VYGGWWLLSVPTVLCNGTLVTLHVYNSSLLPSESSGEPVPAQFVKFQQLQDSLGRILSLKVMHTSSLLRFTQVYWDSLRFT